MRKQGTNLECVFIVRFRLILLSVFGTETLRSVKGSIGTVNPEIFARILISRIALKDILSTGNFRDYGMIHLYQ